MYNIMKKLITKKLYDDMSEASKKVDVFYACNKLTDEEYADLTTLISEIYNPELLEETV